MGQRRRGKQDRAREPALVWWVLFSALLATAWLTWSWRVLLLALTLWCLYELSLVPTVCRVSTRTETSCGRPVRGRLFACEAEHQKVKTEVLLRNTGLRRTRTPTPPDPNRTTGFVVFSPRARGRLVVADQAILLLAALGTIVAVAGMVYGLSGG